MDRGASSGFLAELALPANTPCYLVDVYFDSSTDRMTDAPKNLVIGGNTYYAQGHMLGFSGLNEAEGMYIPNVTVSVSGIDQAFIAIALATPYLDRRLTISKAFITAAGIVADTPVVIFDGKMLDMNIADDPNGQTVVTVSATNQFSDFEFTPGRHTNMAEQQALFPGDLFFDFSAEDAKEVTWGTK